MFRQSLACLLCVCVCLVGCGEVSVTDEVAISEKAVELADLTETIRTSQDNRERARETCKMLGKEFDAFCRENEVPTSESINEAIATVTVACKDPKIREAYVAEMKSRNAEPLSEIH